MADRGPHSLWSVAEILLSSVEERLVALRFFQVRRV